MSEISYNHASISAGVGDLHTSMTTLNATLDQLRSYLQPLVSTWEGQSAVAYTALQQQWDGAAADLNSMLGSIAVAAGQANDGMQSADRALANNW